MGRDYRDRRGRHPRDAGDLANRAGLSSRALFDGLPREPGDALVVEAARDGPRLEGLEPLQPLALTPDVALVADSRLENGFLLPRQRDPHLRCERPYSYRI